MPNLLVLKTDNGPHMIMISNDVLFVTEQINDEYHPKQDTPKLKPITVGKLMAVAHIAALPRIFNTIKDKIDIHLVPFTQDHLGGLPPTIINENQFYQFINYKIKN